MTTITVDPAFQGIQGVAHGGYLAGLLAQRYPRSRQVTLHLPPPLSTPLTVEEHDNGADLRDPEGRTVMRTRPAAGVRTDLPVRTVGQVAGHDPHPGFMRHPYPGCFMCGTRRPDGFQLRVGPAADGMTAGVWRPSSPLLPEREAVPAEYVWAVIDCLTAWAFADHWSEPTWWPAVTAQMTVTVENEVRRDRDHVVLARVVEHHGRRITVQATVADAAGHTLARAETRWVVVPAAPGPTSS
jgi:acyl-coenzyme A thioesterase PaaI-like protein